jgi:hypothetical protein
VVTGKLVALSLDKIPGGLRDIEQAFNLYLENPYDC